MSSVTYESRQGEGNCTGTTAACLPIDRRSLELAVGLLRDGRPVAVPTETVYGLAVDATNPNAVQRIYQIKGRPSTNPLIIHIGEACGSLDALARMGWIQGLSDQPRVASIAQRLMTAFWPGPLTILLPRGPAIPACVSAGLPYAGFRMPAHVGALWLLEKLHFPLAAPSANKSTRISPTSAQHVMSELGADIPLILDGGDAPVGIESTVVGIESDGSLRILRPGGLAIQELLAAAQTSLATTRAAPGPQLSPGMSRLHYAPTKPVILCEPQDLHRHVAEQLGKLGGPAGVLLLDGPTSLKTELEQSSMSKGLVVRQCADAPDASGAVVARRLFGLLRELDESPARAILAEFPPKSRHTIGLWPAIADRLTRAGAPRA